jgi:hypothetical protein
MYIRKFEVLNHYDDGKNNAIQPWRVAANGEITNGR